MPRLSVAIVGGGLGGLTAANALHRRGIATVVFEQAAVFSEVGAGVLLSPNSLRHLEGLGFAELLAGCAAQITGGQHYYRMDGTSVPPPQFGSRGNRTPCGVHRADLLEIMAAALPEGGTRLGHRCIGYEQRGKRTHLIFDNGATAEADVVIAADGIHSRLQCFVVPPSKAVNSGVKAYRGLVPRQVVSGWPSDRFQLWMGDHKHFVAFPVRGGDLINYVAFVPSKTDTDESWSAPGDSDELRSAFEEWDWRVVQLLQKVESCFWWGLYDREPLARWVEGRLALLGDAAHPMLPHLGQGANQAVEDAVALAVLLDGTSAESAPNALVHYECLRRERTSLVQRMARENGRMFDTVGRDLVQRDEALTDSGNFRRWLYDYDVAEAAIAYRRLADVGRV
jgi:salicylate hydroxylase